jgi:ribonuclease HI
MPELPALTIHTDGASRGNPGDAAFAFVITGEGRPTVEEAGLLGRVTNNQAEYAALIKALERAVAVAPGHPVVVHSDSELMVKQMRGEYKVKSEDLRDLYEQARRLVARFPAGVSFRHVRREQNKRADELCNLALDGQRGGRAAAAARGPSALEEEALACLREAEALPSPEAVWKQLVKVLKKHGARGPF